MSGPAATFNIYRSSSCHVWMSKGLAPERLFLISKLKVVAVSVSVRSYQFGPVFILCFQPFEASQ